MPRPSVVAALFAIGAFGAAVGLYRAPAAEPELSYKAVVPGVVRDGLQVSTPPPVATATATPTAVPTVAPTGLQVQGDFMWTDSIGYVHVTGFVVNNLGVTVEFVQVTASFYSAAGQLLDTDFTYTLRRQIPAGETSPFEVILISQVTGVDTATLAVTDYDTDPFFPPVTGLTVTPTNYFVDIIGYGHVIGTVSNNSSFTYDFVQVAVSYVRQGRVVSVEWTYTKPTTLAPGQAGTFEILVSPSEAFDPNDASTSLTYFHVDADRD